MIHVPDGAELDYFVQDDPAISDILLVAADPDDSDVEIPAELSEAESDGGNGGGIPPEPECEHEGYDCHCTYVPPVEPKSRIPTFAGCPDYLDYEYDVADFNALQTSLGYTDTYGWKPIPDGYWGYFLYLDQPTLWGYTAWDEWKFGIVIRDANGTAMDWCPIAGVTEYDATGQWVYRYIYKIPDNDETNGDIDIDQCFTPTIYDGSSRNGAYDANMASQYAEHDFCINEPYLNGLNWMETIIGILFGWADSDSDGCVTYDEFWGIIQWSMMDTMNDFEVMLSETFSTCDVDGTGLLTWAEFNDC